MTEMLKSLKKTCSLFQSRPVVDELSSLSQSPNGKGNPFGGWAGRGLAVGGDFLGESPISGRGRAFSR